MKSTATPGDAGDAGPSQPLAVGYLRAHLLMTETELADAKTDLADCASREGFDLAAVFVEQIDQAPAAFAAMVAEVRRSEATAVIVPGLHHLAPVGAEEARDLLEHDTGARVLTARHSP